jgi:VIT1/CCC1 family predicted Fe2+/Mn2+ transporter
MTESYEGSTTDDRVDDRSIGELFSDVSKDLSTLMRQEVELAKAELRQEASKAGKASAMLVGAGVAGLLLLIFASAALMWALAAVMPTGWAALIVAVIWAIIAAILAQVGRTRLKSVNAVPERTVQTVKEDAQWAKNRAK